MKKFTAILMFATALTAPAQLNFNYSTNLYYALPNMTNIYNGTNGTDTNGDSYHLWANKINHDMNLSQQWHESDSNQIVTASAAFTNYLGTNLFYASTTWNLNTITNGMVNFSFSFPQNSNGAALVIVYLSNTVPYIKQIAP